MAIIKLTAVERRKLSVFITCFVLAFIAWVFVTLSNKYRYTAREVVNFKNAPQKKAFHSLQSDTVDVTMMGSGWHMLFSKLHSQDQPFNIDIHTLENKKYVVLNNQLKQINAERDMANQIIAVNPDTLYFDFTNRIVKKVPVKLMLSINYQQRFGLSNHINIKPSYITVSGPANKVNAIKYWPTDSLKLTKINQTVSRRLNVKPVNDGSVMIYPKAVEINIPVDEFTEKTLEVPVKLINQNYNIVKIFPQKVKVTFTASLNRYAEINEAFFEATANLNLWRTYGYKRLPVKFTRVPSFCKIVTVEPANIDFIVKK